MRTIAFPSYAGRLQRRNLILAAVAIGIGLCLMIASRLTTGLYSPILLIGSFPFFFCIALPVKTAFNAWCGDKGESLIARELSALDDRYLLVTNWVPIEGKGDVDLMLLGPHGVLVIEAKTYTNDCKCEGDKWSVKVGDRNYWKPIKSVSSQLRGNVQRVKQALGSELRTPNSKSQTPNCLGVLVFNDRANLDVATCPERLVRRREVLAFVRGLPEVNVDAEGIEAKLSGLTLLSKVT